MRKIKVNKKEIEKKHKKIDALLQDLVKYHFHLHDEKKVLETVANIAKLKPDEPMPAEKVASIYIDYNKTEEAEKAVDYLEEKFPPNAYRLFLRARVCDMKSHYGDCIKYGEKALTYPNTDVQTSLMIYNILGHAYRYAGDAVNSLKYYELSAKMDISKVKEPAALKFVNKIKREDFSNFLFGKIVTFSLSAVPRSPPRVRGGWRVVPGGGEHLFVKKNFTHTFVCQKTLHIQNL